MIPLIIAISIVYWSVLNGISPTPTTQKQKEEIFGLIPSNPSGNVYEIGSGFGTLVIALAKRLPNCRIIGIENSPFPFVVSRMLIRLSGVSNVELRWKNFVSVNLSDASLIVSYLHPGGIRKLKPKLETEVRENTPVICNTFSIPGWDPETVVRVNDLYHSPIYLYRIHSLIKVRDNF